MSVFFIYVIPTKAGISPKGIVNTQFSVYSSFDKNQWMKVDYIIVGSGLAGILFCEVLKHHNKTYVVYEDYSQKSSTVAGGLYNPVILKRFTKVWNAKEQLNIALSMYKTMEETLKVKLDYKMPIYRLFASIEEQNNWFAACDKPNLAEFLSTKLVANTNTALNGEFGFGEVVNTGRIDTKQLVLKYREQLEANNNLIKEVFNYEELVIDSGVRYNDYEAKHIVFAEGFGVAQNPFFKYLPMNPVKGELITIHAPDLKIDFVLKSSVFLIPLEEDLYLVGATYNWKDISNSTSKSGKQELVSKLKTIINCEFKVVKQVAGIRPTVLDRRPLVGKHPKLDNVYVLNGLGTRGVMIAPFVALELYNFIEHNHPLNKEINISRFDKD